MSLIGMTLTSILSIWLAARETWEEDLDQQSCQHIVYELDLPPSSCLRWSHQSSISSRRIRSQLWIEDLWGPESISRQNTCQQHSSSGLRGAILQIVERWPRET